MSFAGFRCWDESRLHQVLDIEALEPARHVYLATHHPVPMLKDTRAQFDVGADSPHLSPYDEQAFLRDFLDEGHGDLTFVPILGDTGTGKSHLVRLLELQIAPIPGRRLVIPIRRARTNLRAIIEAIVDRASHGSPEPERFDPFRQRLRRAQAQDPAMVRARLLDEIALLVGPRGPGSSELPPEDQELQKPLEDFLHEPQVRDLLLADGRLLHRLAEHLLGHNNELEDVTDRRQFSEPDLPLHPRRLSVRELSAQGQKAYRALTLDDESRMRALASVNRVLDEAMAGVIEVRDDLTQVMNDLRADLGARGVELVLLIEDFARLQGIDRPLLDALIARESGRLCRLRVALGCTTGYFRSVEKTVAQRTTFRVVLDVGMVGQGLVGPQDVSAFAARYLNALRVPDSALERWAKADVEGSPPSACATCEHQSTCHGAFGGANGMGLYPFTDVALARMLARVSKNGQFNPRLLIRDVLRHVLEHHGAAIESGQFPPEALLTHFAPATLPARLQNEIRERDPVNAGRRRALLDLWSDARSLVDLPPGVHEAFQLPAIAPSAGGSKPTATLTSTKVAPAPKVVPPRPTPTPQVASTPAPDEQPPSPSSPIPERTRKLLEELDAWGNEKKLTTTTAQELRDYVHKAVVSHADWDSHLLLWKHVGEKDPFLARDVRFRGEQAAARPNAATLRLPLKETPEDVQATVEALQGALLFAVHGHWNFAGGPRYMRAYASELESWSAHLLRQIRNWARTTKDADVWDPAPAAVQLLVIGARLDGRPRRQDASAADLLHEALHTTAATDDDNSVRSAPWRKLASAFRDASERLQAIVKARTAGTKGQSRDLQMIDAAPLLEAIRELRVGWVPTRVPPADLRQDYELISKLQGRFKREARAAVEEERQQLLAWQDRIVSLLGTSAEQREATLQAVVAASEAARAAGVRPGSHDDLVAATTAVARRQAMDFAMTTVERLRQSNTFPEHIDALARDHGEVISTTQAALDACERFLTETQRRVSTDLEALRREAGDAADAVDQIRANLDVIPAIGARLGIPGGGAMTDGTTLPLVGGPA